jgi:hypothetical protein
MEDLADTIYCLSVCPGTLLVAHPPLHLQRSSMADDCYQQHGGVIEFPYRSSRFIKLWSPRATLGLPSAVPLLQEDKATTSWRTPIGASVVGLQLQDIVSFCYGLPVRSPSYLQLFVQDTELTRHGAAE